jgi:putative ABC transport system permease protein
MSYSTNGLYTAGTSVFFVELAGLLCCLAGFVLAWVLVHVINVRSFGWTLQIALEPRFFLQSLLIAVGAAVLAGLYPAQRLARMTISEALRQE